MTPLVADAEMARVIEAATGSINIVDEQGNIIALCLPLRPQKPAYPPEEIERRRKGLAKVREEVRKHPERGKSLREIMVSLRHGAT